MVKLPGQDNSSRQIIVKTDANALLPLDEETLAPEPLLTYTSINPDLSGFLSAAHGEYDPTSDSYFNFTMDVGAQPTTKIFEISPTHPSGRVLAKIKTGEACYIHSFFSTKKYIIFGLYPLEMRWKGLKLLWEGSLTNSYVWRDGKPTVFYVVDRTDGGVVAEYETSAFFVFHSYVPSYFFIHILVILTNDG